MTKVICVETKEIYSSIKVLAEKLNLTRSKLDTRIKNMDEIGGLHYCYIKEQRDYDKLIDKGE